MPESETLVGLQIQLARIEETLKPLAALIPTVAEVKDVSKEAMALAMQSNQKLEAWEPSLEHTERTAAEALRKAEEAIARLELQEDDRKWIRRSFYGPLLSSIASIFAAAILAYIGLIDK